MTNQTSYQTLRHTLVHTVHFVRHLTSSAYIVRCSRGHLTFTPGQHLSVGPKNNVNMREYSVFSGDKENFLEILVKEVENGLVSKELKKLNPKDEIIIEGPLGFFMIEESQFEKPLYMIATGTGIAPFHCFAKSYPNLSFTVLHGVRTSDELYAHQIFLNDTISYIPCLSKEPPTIISSTDDTQPTSKKHSTTSFQGRVTDYLKSIEIDREGIYFICGNCDMIYEAFDILQQNGVSPEHIKAEVYF